MAGSAFANGPHRGVGRPLAFVAIAFLVTAVLPLRAAADDVFQEAVNYVFTGSVSPDNGPTIADRPACVVIVPDPRNKRLIRYYLNRFKMDDSRFDKTYSGRKPLYTLEVDGDDVIIEYLSLDKTSILSSYKTAQISVPGDFDQTQKALNLIFSQFCKAGKPKSPF